MGSSVEANSNRAELEGEIPAMLSSCQGPVSPETIGCGSRATFPFRLHDMLNDAEEKNFDHIISWQGLQAFKVHDRDLLEKDILPVYFLQTRYKSFSRQRKSSAKLSLSFHNIDLTFRLWNVSFTPFDSNHLRLCPCHTRPCEGHVLAHVLDPWNAWDV